MTVTISFPYATKKKVLQAGNHWLSASKRGRSNAFKLQQGGWISAKCSVGEDSENGAGIFGEPLAPPAWLQPQAGDGAPRLPGPLLPVPGWSSATIWGKMPGTGQRQIQCHHFVVTGHLLYLTHGKAGNVKM